jgi:uncharacterized protein YkwD
MLKNMYSVLRNFISLFLLSTILSCSTVDTVSLHPKRSDMIHYVSNIADLTEVENELLLLFNQYRVNLNLNELINDKLCRDLSEKHINYMIVLGELNHHNTFIRRFEILRRGGDNYGEIVGKYYSTANGFYKAFIKSESHRQIIIDNHYTHIGVRLIKDTNDKYYVTCIFSNFL